jgi:polyhydroxyalkanoate synthesis repressor PhaR
MHRKAILIKKYENRRLYDTTGSRYINLEEIAELIKDGGDVKVVDAATGEDITRVVLTQIIMDDAKGAGSAFPLDILRQMVIASGRATQEGALQYMKAMFDMYQNAYRAMAPQLSPFQVIPGSGSRTREGSAVVRAPAAETRTTEVDELKGRVEELEAMISKAALGKKARKARSARKRRRSAKL